MDDPKYLVGLCNVNYPNASATTFYFDFGNFSCTKNVETFNPHYYLHCALFLPLVKQNQYVENDINFSFHLDTPAIYRVSSSANVK